MHAFIFNIWKSTAVQEVEQREESIMHKSMSWFFLDGQLVKPFIFFCPPLLAIPVLLIVSSALNHNCLGLLYSAYVARGALVGFLSWGGGRVVRF